jgi:hypothetical protein
MLFGCVSDLFSHLLFVLYIYLFQTLFLTLSRHFGMAEQALDERKGEIKELTWVLIQDGAFVPPAAAAGPEAEDIGVENADKVKQVYLVAFSHPKVDATKDGLPLKAPSSYTRKKMAKNTLDAFATTQGARIEPLIAKRMVVLREKHESEDLHDHLGVLADRAFRFAPLKRLLLESYGLASHWSCTHKGYASGVAYGHAPTTKKTESDLNKEPYMHPEDTHPPIEIASRAPVTAKATAAAREQAHWAQSEAGKTRRFEDIDIWPIVAREKIADSPNAPEVLFAWAKRCGGPAMVKHCFRNWAKLPELIARSWKVERVEMHVEMAKKSRLDVLHDALSGPCVCGGTWLSMAKELFEKNDIPQQE